MIGTILLIANLIALVFAEQFMSFWWNAGVFGIELGIYLLIFVIVLWSK